MGGRRSRQTLVAFANSVYRTRETHRGGCRKGGNSITSPLCGRPSDQRRPQGEFLREGPTASPLVMESGAARVQDARCAPGNDSRSVDRDSAAGAVIRGATAGILRRPTWTIAHGRDFNQLATYDAARPAVPTQRREPPRRRNRHARLPTPTPRWCIGRTSERSLRVPKEATTALRPIPTDVRCGARLSPPRQGRRQ